jgi:hypothetical protein
VLELLAAIQSVDPPSLVLWGMALFAAGMYPVGFMLGASCSPCCGTPCAACTTGSLPDTVTVTLDGFTDQTPGPDLISLQFSACFGGGASARVTAPGGDPDTDKGPISAVTLTSGGSGYARLGRIEPTLTVSGGTGTGATFTPTITSTNDACGIPTWKLSSVSVKDGSGYIDGESLTITVAEGDTEAQTATAVVNTTRTQPTLSASIGGGTGATFTVTTSPNYGTPTTWGVASVAVTNGGSGYLDGGAMTFSGGGDLVVAQEAQAYIVTVRSEPSLIGSVSSSGNGASITPTLTEYTGWDGRPYWSVTGFTIANGGTGYAENDLVEVTVSDGTASPWAWFSAYVSSVDQDGAILAITIDFGGEYWKDTGVIQSVEVWYGGAYFDDNGIPTGVTVTSGGQYYREDESEPPYVADVTVTVASQSPPSDGTGATFTATVEDDQESPNFGKITSLTIDDGGDDYLAWQWKNTKCCGDYYNGLSVVLQRSGCIYSHNLCGVGNLNLGAGRITLEYFGPSVPPVLRLFSEVGSSAVSSACNAVLTASGNVSDCGDWSGVSFSASGGRTATVSVGGEYDPLFRNPGGRSCHICCKGEEFAPSEIEFDISSTNGSPTDGVYVRSGFPFAPNLAWGNFFTQNELGLLAYLELCADQSSTGFAEHPVCGDNCHKKCRIVVDISHFGVRYWNATPGPSDPNDCQCQDTPMCDPFGTYTLCRSTNPNDCPFQVEIRAPL